LSPSCTARLTIMKLAKDTGCLPEDFEHRVGSLDILIRHHRRRGGRCRALMHSLLPLPVGRPRPLRHRQEHPLALRCPLQHHRQRSQEDPSSAPSAIISAHMSHVRPARADPRRSAAACCSSSSLRRSRDPDPGRNSWPRGGLSAWHNPMPFVRVEGFDPSKDATRWSTQRRSSALLTSQEGLAHESRIERGTAIRHEEW
jgi:hypothetical protein